MPPTPPASAKAPTVILSLLHASTVHTQQSFAGEMYEQNDRRERKSIALGQWEFNYATTLCRRPAPPPPDVQSPLLLLEVQLQGLHILMLPGVGVWNGLGQKVIRNTNTRHNDTYHNTDKAAEEQTHSNTEKTGRVILTHDRGRIRKFGSARFLALHSLVFARPPSVVNPV